MWLPRQSHRQLCTCNWHQPALACRRACGASPQTITVRLAEVDAPEKAQSYGGRSKQNLSALCFRKSADVRPVSLDRYGRTIARVTCDGHDASVPQTYNKDQWISSFEDVMLKLCPANRP